MRRTSVNRPMKIAIRRAYTNANMIVWATVNAKEIMNFLGISNSNWAIGGSIAGMLIGIDFGRIPHDVDIIVPAGFIDVIKLKVENSTLFRAEPTTSSIDDEWGTKHFAFRSAKGYTIDIIENKDFFDETRVLLDNVNIMAIDALIKHKKMYHEEKDIKDLELLQKCAIDMGFDDIDESSNPKSDIDTLAELKAKMEECK